VIIQIISCSSYIYLYYLYKYIWLVIRWYNIYLWNHYGAPMTLLQCLEWVCWRTSVTFATSETLQNWAHLGQLVVPECPYFRCTPQKRFFITNLMRHETNYQKFSILNTQAKSTLLRTLALNIVKKKDFLRLKRSLSAFHRICLFYTDVISCMEYVSLNWRTSTGRKVAQNVLFSETKPYKM